MNIEQFIEAVREMRRHQKLYFRDRLQVELIEAKKQEAVVDKALKEGVIFPTLESTEAEPEQGKLFGE